MELTQGLVIAQRFRLVRELGRGGMGSVWLAHHTSLDTPCAVKFINAEAMDMPEVRARFEREAKAAASLRSPNVVNIIDYGHSEVGPYIAMEFLEGEDLANRLARRGRLTPHETVDVVQNVARALQKAHAAGLVHRDLKPENVFLVRDEDREIVKVLDFGIAKANRLAGNDGATKTGSLLGTPSYMSPEQAQGTKTVDYRSDLWSLGVLAFRCLTGRLPFVSEALGDLLVQIIVSPLPQPSQIAPDLPPSFDAWWARAAARDPAQRFASAREQADALAVAFGLAASPGPSSFEVRAPSGSHPYAGYATPPGAQPGWGRAGGPSQAPVGAWPASHTGSGASGAVPAQSGHLVVGAPVVPASGSWGGVAPQAAAGPTALGVAHTMGGPAPAPAAGSGSRTPVVVGAIAVVAGVAIAAAFLARSGGGTPAAPSGAAAASVEAPASSALAEPTATATASAEAPAPSATPAAASATASAATPPAPVTKPPAGPKPGPAPAPPRRGRLVLPGSN